MSAPLVNLITKSSLIGVVPQFSANIADNDFVAANDFANKRLKKLIPAALWTRLTEIYSLSTWSNSTAYVTGNEVVLNSRGYKALQNGTNKNPATETDYWQEIEIYSVFRDYLKPFLCWQAYNHFLIYHGLFVSQGGIRKHIDMNAEEAPAEERSRAIKRAQETADLLYMDFQKYMEDVSNTIDTVVYSFTDTATFKPRIGIHIIKTIILFLLASNLSAQYPLPIVNEARNYHFTKTVYIDGRLKVGYPTPTIARDIHFVSDTLRFEGLDGTGSILGIDANGDVTRVTGVGAAGVTGLNDYEPLFGSLTGIIEQDNLWHYNPTTNYMRIGDPSGSAGGEIAVVDGTHASSMTATSIGVSGSVGQTIMNGQYFTLYDLDAELFSIGRAAWSVDEVLLFPAAKGALNQSLQVSNVTGDNVTLSWYTPTSGTVTSFSFTDGSGFDGTVTNSTTTPTLALTTTVTDNQIMVSNSGAVQGSASFTFDDVVDNETFSATVLDFNINGTDTYGGLFNANTSGTVSIGDLGGVGNGANIIIEDPNDYIGLDAATVRFVHLNGAGDRLTYADNDGDLLPVTLTANDFDFSGPTLSIDYTNGQTASTSTKGFLTDTDWDTFNNKVSFDINSQSSETSLAFDDEIPIYDVSEGAINKTTYETVLSASPTNFRNYRFTYFNEFLNTVGTATGGNDIIATNSGTGAGTNNQATSAAERVGLVRSTTGSTATGRTSPGTSSTACAFGGGSWVYEIEIKLTTLSTVTERYQLVLGFHDIQNAANQTDAIAFVYDEGGVSTGSAASANWQTLTASNTARTFTTTSTAVATGWVNLRIEVNAAGNSVTFYVNGTSVATHTTNIPTGTSRVTGFGYLLIKSIGTTARTMDVDYIFCEQDLTTNR